MLTWFYAVDEGETVHQYNRNDQRFTLVSPFLTLKMICPPLLWKTKSLFCFQLTDIWKLTSCHCHPTLNVPCIFCVSIWQLLIILSRNWASQSIFPKQQHNDLFQTHLIQPVSFPHCVQSVPFSSAVAVETGKVQTQSCVAANLGGFCSVFL